MLLEKVLRCSHFFSPIDFSHVGFLMSLDMNMMAVLVSLDLGPALV